MVRRSSVVLLFLLLITFQAFSQSTTPDIPRLIRYSGAVAGSSDQVVGITFALYGTQQGGAAVWTEIQNVKLDANGNYSVLLGSQHPDGVPAELFTSNEAQWLGVQVEGQPEQGRVLLVSVPYAYKAGDAETLGGLPPSAFVANPTYSSTTSSASGPAFSSVQTSTIQPYTVTSSTGTPGQLAKWIDSTTLGNSLVSDNGSYVGVSQTAPGAVLDVNGLLHIGSHTLQTTGLEAFVLGQNSRIGGSADGNALEFRITHDLPSGSSNMGLLFQFRQNDNSGANLWGYSMRQFKTAGEDSTYLTFGTNASAGQSVERLRIDKNGKVGIGTTTPAANLEVVTGLSEVRVSNAATSGGILQLRGNSDGSSDIQMNAYSGTPALRIKASNAATVATFTSGLVSVAGTVESTAGGFKFPDGSILTSANNVTNTTTSTNYSGSTSDQVLHVTQNGAGAGSLTVSTLPSAVRGDATATSNYIAGVLGASSSPAGFGVVGENLASSGYAIGTFGVSTISTTGTGVWGEAEASSGDAVGVYGKSFSVTGTGVLGYANATTGDAVGVYGRTDSTGGTGVWGDSTATSGATFAVYGTVASSSGSAGVFDNTASGNLLLGRASSSHTNVFRVDGTGKGFFNGGTQTSGADFAESVQVLGSNTEYQPGDVLMIDSTGTRRLALTNERYSTRVAGIYSTKPGILATPHAMDDARLATEEVPLAVVGIVPCKVSTENGPIEAGDLLVSSSTPGYAMKGTDRGRMLGAVVGKAMQPLHQGSGVIEVLVSLH